MHEFAFILSGFAVGLIVGLTGVGGGSLMTPLLIFGFGIKPHMAIGTDLLFAAFTKMGGTVSLARRRLVPWRLVATLSMGSIPAALATLYVLHSLGPASPLVQKTMTLTLGVALLLTALATLYKAIQDKQVPRQIAQHQLAAATHCGGGHCLRRTTDFGGWIGPCIFGFCGLAAAGLAADRLFARHLAGISTGAQNT